jgi:hypothetical protein
MLKEKYTIEIEENNGKITSKRSKIVQENQSINNKLQTLEKIRKSLITRN